MQISVQIVVQTEVDEQANITEIAHFEREGFDAGSLGLQLDEAKALLGRLQHSMIEAQADEAIARMSVCPECGSRLTVKGHHRLVYRSVFGRLSIDSPRLYQCRCSGSGRRSVSPLASCLRERTSPELQYLQAKFAALMSYGLSVRVLEEVYRLSMCSRPPRSGDASPHWAVALSARTQRSPSSNGDTSICLLADALFRSTVQYALWESTAAISAWPDTAAGRTAGSKSSSADHCATTAAATASPRFTHSSTSLPIGCWRFLLRKASARTSR